LAVLVTDGNQRSSLAVVRSLGRAGVEVCVGESDESSLAGASRYCSDRVCYPSPVAGPESFLEFMRKELAKGRYELLIPTTDMTVQLVMQGRDSFPTSMRIPFPRREQVCLAQDKRYVLDLARRLGIPCPEDYACDPENIEEVARTLKYPVVLKPRVSRLFRDGRWIQGSVRYALEASALVAGYREIDALIANPIVQEKLEGEGRGVFLLMWNGEVKAAFCHRRLREKPPWGGVSVYSESLPLDTALVEKSQRLLQALGWQGVAMAEFKMDPRDGQAKLMEVNGRFWGSLQLAINSGVDFPYLLYSCAMGEEVRSQWDYKAGVKTRWLLGDLDHLLIRLAKRRAPAEMKAHEGSRLAAVGRFLKLYEPGLNYEVEQLRDPGPSFHEIKHYLGHGLRRLGARKGEAHAS
jgi:predicted ATP-grasp superfamily ATP-dependent carboligase